MNPKILITQRAITLLLILVSIVAHTQPIDYATWQAESKTNIRLLPEYGNVPKTREQKLADAKFIDASLEKHKSARKASDEMVDVGFDYLYKQDIKTAMYRFNQAWLLDHQNENAYWGFGAIYMTFNDPDEAMKQYDKGLKINPKSPNILTDKATAYVIKFNESNVITDQDSAANLFKRSYAIDPKNQNTLFRSSALYFMKGDCKQAVKYYDECMALGGKPISKQYKEAIQRCKK